MVSVYDCGVVLEPVATVSVEVAVPPAGGVTEVGLKLQVAPPVVGQPDTVRLTALLNPFNEVRVTVEVPEAPCVIVSDVGFLEIEKFGGGGLTCNVRVVVCVMLPPMPVTVIVYVPVAVVEATVMVMVEVPAPGAAMDKGLRVTVTPVG